MTAQTDLYDSLLADVFTLTNRPDLELETELALRTATLSIHGSNMFPRDIETQLVKIPNASYLTSLDIQANFPRLRGLVTVQICDDAFAPVSKPEIEIVELGDVRDPVYKQIKKDIAYLAGAAINISSSIPSYGYLVEYSRQPNVRREAYDSWIAQLDPAAIVFSAASIVLSTNGNEEKAKSYSNMVEKMLKPALVTNYLTSAMR